MYTDMDWWTKIRLEVLRGEASKREERWTPKVGPPEGRVKL